MINDITRRHKRYGFGLVELLLAMVIGMFLTAGLVQIFIGSKKAYGTQKAMGRVQENGRFAMGILSRDIRMAGYTGCGNLSKIEPNIIAKDPPGTGTFGSEDAIRGDEHIDTSLPLACENENSTSSDPPVVLPNTDVITISGADDCGAHLVGNMTVENANVQINGDNSCDFKAGDLILISDCASSDLFRATSVSEGGDITIAHAQSVNGNTSNFLSKAYGEDARIYRFNQREYSVRNNRAKEPALYRRDYLGTPRERFQELVEGVCDMQILYGEDTGGDPFVDGYVAAGAVSNWSSVGAVRLNLGLTSLQDIVSVDADPDTASREKQQRLLQTMTSTIGVRNKLP